MAIIEVRNLVVGYGNNVVIQGASFVIDRPSFVAIVGPNGAGKTTLIRVLAGLLRPRSGQVKILDIDVTKKYPRWLKTKIGYVPQRDFINYTVPITVREVILSGIVDLLDMPRIVTTDVVEARVYDIAKMLGIEHILDRFFEDLSGGLQQRVLLARALARDPTILLLDEPLSNVDEMTRVEILTLLKSLVEKGKTVLLVTHDINVAVEWADYTLLITRGRVYMFRSAVKEDIMRLMKYYPEEDRRIIPPRTPYCA